VVLVLPAVPVAATSITSLACTLRPPNCRIKRSRSCCFCWCCCCCSSHKVTCRQENPSSNSSSSSKMACPLDKDAVRLAVVANLATNSDTHDCSPCPTPASEREPRPYLTETVKMRPSRGNSTLLIMFLP
jgi:hypothetical protein